VAGRKVFTSGEILTAADVNSFLMDQSVMVFADSSARSSAIPSPTEGMVTYLEDTNAVEKYDGSAFVNVAPGGLVAVESALKTDTFSASVAAGGNVAVTDLSITHSLSDASNRLFLFAMVFTAGGSESLDRAELVFSDGSNLFPIGDAASSRTRATAGRTGGNEGSTKTIGTVVEPGSTASTTYTVNIQSSNSTTQTLYANRVVSDPSEIRGVRFASTFILMEVAV